VQPTFVRKFPFHGGHQLIFELFSKSSASLPRALDDKEVAIINNTFASQTGLSASRDGLMVEDKESPYVNLIVARENNKDETKVKNFVKAYQSPEVENAAKIEFKGSAVKGW
jgi:D-methionine transport system substrate-binding protein